MEFSLPLCCIPLTSEEYKTKVQTFYKGNSKQRVEEYRRRKERSSGIEIKSLHWDQELGLTSITLSTSIGLDLEPLTMRYTFHNLWDENSKEGRLLFTIAKYYIEKLK